jgi:hypothetical protein
MARGPFGGGKRSGKLVGMRRDVDHDAPPIIPPSLITDMRPEDLEATLQAPLS